LADGAALKSVEILSSHAETLRQLDPELPALYARLSAPVISLGIVETPENGGGAASVSAKTLLELVPTLTRVVLGKYCLGLEMLPGGILEPSTRERAIFHWERFAASCQGMKPEAKIRLLRRFAELPVKSLEGIMAQMQTSSSPVSLRKLVELAKAKQAFEATKEGGVVKSEDSSVTAPENRATNWSSLRSVAQPLRWLVNRIRVTDMNERLEACIKSGALDEIKAYAANGMNIHHSDPEPLAIAAGLGQVEIMKVLLASGGNDPSIVSDALHRAAIWGAFESAKLLIAHGGIPSENALESACNNRHPALANYLLRAFPRPPVAFIERKAAVYLKGESPAQGKVLTVTRELFSPESKNHVSTLFPKQVKELLGGEAKNNDKHPFISVIHDTALASAILQPNTCAPIPSLFFTLMERNIAMVEQGRCSWATLAKTSSASAYQMQNVADISREFGEAFLFPALAYRYAKQFGADQLRNLGTQHVASLRERMVELSGKILFGDKSLLELQRFNRLWHRPDKRLPLELRAARAAGTWYPLCDSVKVTDDAFVVPVISKDGLVHEGKELQHCVGGGSYATACLEGRTHILSIKHNGRALATAEVRESGEKSASIKVPNSSQHLKLVQFKGMGNSEPSALAKTIWEDFGKLVESGKVTINFSRSGETDESKRQSDLLNSLPPIEKALGGSLEIYPGEVLEFYRKTMRLVPSSERKHESTRRINLVGQLEWRELDGFFAGAVRFLHS
jgi:hypothetical protein